MVKTSHKTPTPGDDVCMGITDDVDIQIDWVSKEQPLMHCGIFFVVDQYGDEHIIEEEGDHWITVTCSMLPD